ncbi:SDR family oxidoreductase [Mycobacterium sp. URHB0021]
MVDVYGSTAVVTGGQRGLGKAIVDELLRRGAARVYATARKPEPDGDPRVVWVPCDVTDAVSVAELADTASDATIVFNNAGTNAGRPSLLDGDWHDIRAVFETNFFGVLRVTRAFAPILARNGGGALIDIVSVLSWMSGTGAYGCSKAALWSATNSLRIALQPQGTLVTGVHVGYIDADMTRDIEVAKAAADEVAYVILEGVENDDSEILVDDLSRRVKAALTGPPERLRLH